VKYGVVILGTDLDSTMSLRKIGLTSGWRSIYLLFFAEVLSFVFNNAAAQTVCV
jgi:hypothetical protein